MSLYTKNLIVGVTVLVALILLGWMILLFGDVPARLFAKPQMAVKMMAPRADGLSEGSSINYRGVNVGRVRRIQLSADQKDVEILAMVDETPPLPANVEGVIRSQVFGGTSSVELQLVPPAEGQPPTPAGKLTSEQTVVVRYVGVDLLPPEFAQLAEDLRMTSRQLRESNLVPNLNQTVLSIKTQVEKAGAVLDSMQSLVSDEQMRKNLRTTVANLAAATETAGRVAENLEKLSKSANTHLDDLAKNGNTLLTHAQSQVDDMSKQLGDRLGQVAKVLENFEAVSRKLNEGQGTASMLINDPKLYEALVDTSKELKVTISDLRRLVQQWEQEGLYFKLSK